MAAAEVTEAAGAAKALEAAGAAVAAKAAKAADVADAANRGSTPRRPLGAAAGGRASPHIAPPPQPDGRRILPRATPKIMQRPFQAYKSSRRGWTATAPPHGACGSAWPRTLGQRGRRGACSSGGAERTRRR